VIGRTTVIYKENLLTPSYRNLPQLEKKSGVNDFVKSFRNI